MTQRVIAGAYEIISEIGSGGGGVVYLGRHQRLDKQVVLKADKRKITTRLDMLRREVDALKNLSHTYIPQVYDYVVEDETVFTVMDFVEGESFDKPLKQGIRFTQPQVIEWATQLLDALCYLHGRPPHGILHADLKPANVMLTPAGDIRLIDFNIALALGASGAVAVGSSLGYASPEHLGLDFSTSSTTARGIWEARKPKAADARNLDATMRLSDMTEDVSPVPVASPSTPQASATPASAQAPVSASAGASGAVSGSGSGSGTGTGKRIMLDVRSDVYGLGATLYHILSGIRPAHRVRDVVPLSDRDFSQGLAAIINKAMNPNPDLRFQTAREMLEAFLRLRDDDPRVLRWKRMRNITCVVLTALFLAGGITAFAGVRQTEAEQRQIAQQERAEADIQRAEAERQSAEADVQRAEAERQSEEADIQRAEAERQSEEAETQRVEAARRRAEAEAEREEAARQRTEAELQESYAFAERSVTALRDGDKTGAVRFALEAVPAPDDLNQVHVAEAKKALADALGVYELSDGYKSYKSLVLESEVIKTALSDDGLVAAALSYGNLTVFDTASAVVLDVLPTVESALSDAVFLADGTLVYAGEDGLCAYTPPDPSAGAPVGELVWTAEHATAVTVSADSTTIAAVYRDESLARVYTANGELISELPFEGKSLRVVTNDRLADPEDSIFTLNADGSLLAVSFSDGSLRVFNIANRDNDIILSEPSDYTHFEGGFFGPYFAYSATRAEDSLFAVIDTVRFVETLSTSLPARIGVHADESGIYMSYNNTHVGIDPLTAEQTPIPDDPAIKSAGGFLLQSSIDSPTVRILRYEEHSDLQIFSYEPDYVHDEARLSADGETVMLFDVNGFRLFGKDGGLINETELPDPGDIYDQQYRRKDGVSYLEVIYYSGVVREYSAADGSMTSERLGEPPDESLNEEFITDEIKITAPLHGAAAAYSLETGELVRELEQDAYMTYVTQAGEYIVAEYISFADNSRYGLLLDGKTCETLAYMPNLCDVVGTRLIFDLRGEGSLRETRIYDIAELIALK